MGQVPSDFLERCLLSFFPRYTLAALGLYKGQHDYK